MVREGPSHGLQSQAGGDRIPAGRPCTSALPYLLASPWGSSGLEGRFPKTTLEAPTSRP